MNPPRETDINTASGENRKPLMLMLKITTKTWEAFMERVAKETGIPESYREVLMFINRNPGVSQKEIAKHRGITTAGISQIVKDMELTGYVYKEAAEDDKRYLRLYLTDKGKSYANRVREKIHKADQILTQTVTPEKEKEVVDFLAELQKIISEEL